MNWRKILFDVYLKVKGVSLSQEFEKLDKKILKGQNQPELKNDLKEQLIYAKSNVPFYKKVAGEDIEDFPVISKQIVKESYSQFESNLRTKHKTVSTSGSTGKPFKVKWCSNKALMNQVETLYFGQLVNYEFGRPYVILRIWNELNKKSPRINFLQNIIPVDISDLSDTSLSKVHEELNLLGSKAVVLGYGSTLQALISFLRSDKQKKNKVKLGGIWIMSEPISKNERKFLSEFYHCPVYTRYSNSENGYIGHQTSMNSDAYTLNTNMFHIEFLKLNSNESIDYPRESEARIVVTDLRNKAMPLIRYDTGDVARVKLNEMNQFEIQAVVGRQLDFIHSTEGNLISPHTIDYAVRDLKGLVQFQLTQKADRTNLLKLVLNNSHMNHESTKIEAVKRLRKYLGVSSQIKIEIVKEIPLLQNGKFKMVIKEK